MARRSPITETRLADRRGVRGPISTALFQPTVPHREDLAPGLLGGERVVDRPLGEAEAVLRARKHLQLIFGIPGVSM